MGKTLNRDAPQRAKNQALPPQKDHFMLYHQYYKQRSPTFYMQRGLPFISETPLQYIEALFKQK